MACTPHILKLRPRHIAAIALVWLAFSALFTGAPAAAQPPGDDGPAINAAVPLLMVQTKDEFQHVPEQSDDVPFDWSWMTLTLYCVLIVPASLLGGLLPSIVALTHTRMQTMISFVGGLMLGIGFLHLMPHASHELGSTSSTANWMMVGIVLMFVMLRMFHFHNHEPIPGSSVARDEACQHDHDHQPHQPAATGETHSPAECHTHGHAHGISWAGIAFGLSIHTLIDGLALAASTQTSAATAGGIAGLGTFLAVLLHKPLDAVSITSLMAVGGHSRKAMHAVNLGFALMCPLGAILFLLGVQQFSGIERELLGTALAFSAGVFICISLSDLLPEMEFHSHNRVQLTTALAVGIAVAWGLTLFENGHLH